MTTSIFKTHSNSLLAILWGIIFAKCFTLEYLVQFYSVPINSSMYIWTLSLSMAAFATFIFAKIGIEESTSAIHLSTIGMIKAGCAIGLLAIAAAGFFFDFIQPFHVPVYLALIMGLGYCALGFIEKSLLYTLSGFGWWFGTAILFRQNSIDSLLIFAILIVSFSVLPTLIWMSRQRRELK
jgi:ethanolamine utilization microcompartment shell protein EutS